MVVPVSQHSFNKSGMVCFHGSLGLIGPNRVIKVMSKSTVTIWGQCQDHSPVTAVSSALALIASKQFFIRDLLPSTSWDEIAV